MHDSKWTSFNEKKMEKKRVYKLKKEKNYKKG